MKTQIYIVSLLVFLVFVASCAPKEVSEEPGKLEIAPTEPPKPLEKPAVQKEIPETVVTQPPQTIPPATPTIVPTPTLINGKTLQERLAEAYERLHTRGSGQHIRDSFPDIKLVYTDKAEGMPFPTQILPFRYYYSREANTTFNICAIELTVFICKGKLDKLIRKGDVDSGRCEMTPIYGDPRL